MLVCEAGDAGLDAGADFDVKARSSGVIPTVSCSFMKSDVPHISHSRSDGWFKKVQAGQGRELNLRLRPSSLGWSPDRGTVEGTRGDGEYVSDDVLADDDGRDLE